MPPAMDSKRMGFCVWVCFNILWAAGGFLTISHSARRQYFLLTTDPFWHQNKWLRLFSTYQVKGQCLDSSNCCCTQDCVGHRGGRWWYLTASTKWTGTPYLSHEEVLKLGYFLRVPFQSSELCHVLEFGKYRAWEGCKIKSKVNCEFH